MNIRMITLAVLVGALSGCATGVQRYAEMPQRPACQADQDSMKALQFVKTMSREEIEEFSAALTDEEADRMLCAAEYDSYLRTMEELSAEEDARARYREGAAWYILGQSVGNIGRAHLYNRPVTCHGWASNVGGQVNSTTCY